MGGGAIAPPAPLLLTPVNWPLLIFDEGSLVVATFLFGGAVTVGEDGKGCREAEACHAGEHVLQALQLWYYLQSCSGGEVVDDYWVRRDLLKNFHPHKHQAQDNHFRRDKEEGTVVV